jgi:hypothetical protein
MSLSQKEINEMRTQVDRDFEMTWVSPKSSRNVNYNSQPLSRVPSVKTAMFKRSQGPSILSKMKSPFSAGSCSIRTAMYEPLAQQSL